MKMTRNITLVTGLGLLSACDLVFGAPKYPEGMNADEAQAAERAANWQECVDQMQWVRANALVAATEPRLLGPSSDYHFCRNIELGSPEVPSDALDQVSAVFRATIDAAVEANELKAANDVRLSWLEYMNYMHGRFTLPDVSVIYERYAEYVATDGTEFPLTFMLLLRGHSFYDGKTLAAACEAAITSHPKFRGFIAHQCLNALKYEKYGNFQAWSTFDADLQAGYDQQLRAKPALPFLTISIPGFGTCEDRGCMADGWELNDQRLGLGINARCLGGNCRKNGWKAEAEQGIVTVNCTGLECLKAGWSLGVDGKTWTAECKDGNCGQFGWTTSSGNSRYVVTCYDESSFDACWYNGYSILQPDGTEIVCGCIEGNCSVRGVACFQP